MASQWIDAATARRIVADGGSLSAAEDSICIRAHAGMLNSRAARLQYGDESKDNCPVPKEFWWAEGDLALEQNWEAGDFSTWIKQEIELRAFGVKFDLAAILALLPIERRPIVARSLSVESNPDWVSARAACAIIEKHEGMYYTGARRRLIELAELGFVSARAVQMSRHHRHSTSLTIEREWDVPLWFWESCIHSTEAKIDWALGSFGGNAFVEKSWCRVNLVGVHFLRAALAPPTETQSDDDKDDGEDGGSKPRLPDPRLQKWWDGKASVREGLSIDDLWTLARASFPDHHISRDRMRVLAGGRKRGPKPIGDESAAE